MCFQVEAPAFGVGGLLVRRERRAILFSCFGLPRLRKNAVELRFREGHGFSRAVKSFQISTALAAEVGLRVLFCIFPQPLQPQEVSRAGAKAQIKRRPL